MCKSPYNIKSNYRFLFVKKFAEKFLRFCTEIDLYDIGPIFRAVRKSDTTVAFCRFIGFFGGVTQVNIMLILLVVVGNYGSLTHTMITTF